MIQEPIILYEHGDVLIFSTVERAAQYIEAIDVENEEYVAYDAAGRMLLLSVRSSTRVEITLPESAQDKSDELQARLAEFLSQVGEDRAEMAGLPLDQLVARSMKHQIE